MHFQSTMSSSFYSLLTGQSSKSQSCPLIELPYLVHRQLLPMLNIQDKQALRLVSHGLRALVDTQRSIHFNVTLSDDTSSIVLKFNHFDLISWPRVLHTLNVTNLHAPLKLSSTSSTRCPLPPVINALAFSETCGVSQSNFIKLVTFYGANDSLNMVQLNLLCLERVESAKILGKGILNLNLIRKLELVFPTWMDANIDCALALLGGTYPSLDTLKIDLNPFGCYHPILYKLTYLMISRHLPGLTTLDIIHPGIYYKPGSIQRLKTLCPYHTYPFLPHGIVQDLTLENDFLPVLEPFFTFHHGEDGRKLVERLHQGCDTLRKLTLEFTSLERYWSKANLGILLVNCQKKLEFLELSLVPLPNQAAFATTDVTMHPLNLPKLLQNCASTLVTLKLVNCLLSRHDDAVWNEDQNYQFDFAHFEACNRLETFVLTRPLYGTIQAQFANLDKLPPSLRRLELPAQVQDQDLHRIRDRLINLKSFKFGYQTPGVSLAQFQMLMGIEGMPTLEEVTLVRGFYDGLAIKACAPRSGITVVERGYSTIFKRQ